MRYALIFLAACSSTTAEPPEKCGETTCASGEVCDRSPATAACVGAADDDDSDGIVNADDLCKQLANNDQFDEDNDGVGDQCDRCPIAPPNDTANTDGDEVDAPCDPEDDLPGNRIVAFSGFRAAPPASWMLPTGWQVQGGELVATVPAVSPGIVSVPILGSNRLAVEASYRVDSINTAGGVTPSVSTVVRDVRPAGTTVMRCGVAKVGTTERVQISTDVADASEVAMNLFDSAALYRLGFLVDGGQTACAVVSNGDADSTKSTAARGGGEQMTEAGLDVGNATARFQWLLVIARAM